jgi:cysteinyl-tRNA synthetase
MAMYFYNTLTKKKEEFKPLKGNKVNMFVCGLTVYDDMHMGHAKTFINFDVIARWIRRRGYELRYIQNITDVDDKIIKRAKERKVEPIELARTYESRFMEDMKRLDVVKNVDVFPRSHDYIEQIRGQIQLLIDRGYAYILESDVYFNVLKFGDYSRLSGMKLEELERHRIEPMEGKLNSYDFSLWKGKKEEGEPSWRIKLKVNGRVIELDGRPGWHIEDTAMAHEFFGPQYDIHGGAIELLFPHHTNEIAQAEAAYGKVPYVKYWLHSGVLNIGGEKMSKSLGNFVTLRSVLEKYEPEAVRAMVCSTHYSKNVDYREETIKEGVRKLGYMYSSLSLIYNLKESDTPDLNDVDETVEKLVDGFNTAMDDDFNAALAMSKLLALVKHVRSAAEGGVTLSRNTKKAAMDAILGMGGVFGILQDDRYKKPVDERALALIKQRESFRKEKKFAEADKIRDILKKDHSIAIEDTEYGTVWYSK